MTRRCKILIRLRIVTISVMLIASGAAAVSASQTDRQREDRILEKVAENHVAVTNNTEKISTLKETITEQDKRIRGLEDSRNKVYGAFAFVTLLFAILNGYMLLLQVKEHLPNGKTHDK